MTKGKFAPVLLVAALALAACGSDGGSSSTDAPTTDAPVTEAPVIDCAPEEGPLKAAWVYVGPANDGGWSQAHDEGRQLVQEHFGDAVETTFKESVPEGPDVAQAVEDLIADGNTVIFGTSFGFQDAFVEVAAANPTICFEFATGYMKSDNMAQFYGAAEDTDYLAGMAAGAASKNGKLGYLASFPIPEVVRGINAWTMGVRAVNPEATVSIVWLNTWFDPAAERKAAEALIAEGVDVLGQKGVDSPATGDAAQAAEGVAWAGYNTDQSVNYPTVSLTSTVYNWSVYEIPRLQQVLDGAWTSGDYYGNLGDGFVTLAPYGDLVSEETRALIDAKKAELAAAPGSQFTGPINDNAGNEVLAAGVGHTFGELMSMAYLVEGVEGEIPAG